MKLNGWNNNLTPSEGVGGGKPYISLGSNFAIAEGGKYIFTYGPDTIDEYTWDWCFVVKKGGKEVLRLTNSELMALCDTDTQSPESMLLTGILAYLSR